MRLPDMLCCALLMLCGIHALQAQEQLVPLKYNSQLFGQQNMGDSRTISADRDTLCLPFHDDFSNRYIYLNETSPGCDDSIFQIASPVYPSALFWTDSDAFVNNTYPVLPPSYGVATLDGLRGDGRPYNEALDYGMADKLTSKPIFLAEPVVDSVYLSFYYQPGGFGEFPNSNDSLILEFLSPDSIWSDVWHVVNTMGDDAQPFRLAMVPVPDAYHYDGFQFRFRNYAGINGNNDHWNIDDVLLDDDRTFNDTLFRDVAIIYQPERYLKRYRQMPWTQFKGHQAEELADEHAVFMYNNFNTIINTSYQYEAKEKYSGVDIVPLTAPVSINFDPFTIAYDGFDNFEIPHTVPNFDEDSMLVNFTYIVTPAGDVNNRNDTLHYTQAFYNYYAYDDGTAERAYALEGTGAKLALRFYANEPDTLKEVYIHWAYVDGSKSNLFFSLMVWDDIDTTLASADENIIFQNDFLSPEYIDSVNGFAVYKLVDFLGNPTPVVVDGYFYVGWLQSQDDFLNVGFDRNNDAHDNVFFNVGGTWQKSSIPGAIMIRPQVGSNYSIYGPVEDIDVDAQIRVFPNPVTDMLYTGWTLNHPAPYTVSDMSGREVMNGTLYKDGISVQGLSAGCYLLQMQDTENGQWYHATFIRTL
ncbi:MAG: T9SS type A sorting domain-containing protein [Chitinophagales bacterium]